MYIYVCHDDIYTNCTQHIMYICSTCVVHVHMYIYLVCQCVWYTHVTYIHGTYMYVMYGISEKYFVVYRVSKSLWCVCSARVLCVWYTHVPHVYYTYMHTSEYFEYFELQ